MLFFIHFHHTNDENVIKIESKLLMIHILDEEVNVPLKCLYVIDSQFFKNGDVFGFKYLIRHNLKRKDLSISFLYFTNDILYIMIERLF